MMQGASKVVVKKGNRIITSRKKGNSKVKMTTFGIFSQGQTDKTRQSCKEFTVLQ